MENVISENLKEYYASKFKRKKHLHNFGEGTPENSTSCYNKQEVIFQVSNRLLLKVEGKTFPSRVDMVVVSLFNTHTYELC